MSSREQILASIRNAVGEQKPLPEWTSVQGAPEDLSAQFLDVLRSVGGQGIVVNTIREVEERLRSFLADASYVNRSAQVSLPAGIDIAGLPVAELAAVRTVILDGRIGVAENAAVWVPESGMGHRILPFSCESLILILHASDLVADMHAAATRVSLSGEGYGVYIAGPSKTADIEQSLVIGAHGPLGLMVFVLS